MLITVLSLMLMLHDGPDPLVAYPLRASDQIDDHVRATLGPPIPLSRPLDFLPTALGGGAELGEEDRLVIAEDFSTVRSLLPDREMTVSA